MGAENDRLDGGRGSRAVTVVGGPARPICWELRRCQGGRTFTAKTRTFLGNPGWLVTLVQDIERNKKFGRCVGKEKQEIQLDANFILRD